MVSLALGEALTDAASVVSVDGGSGVCVGALVATTATAGAGVPVHPASMLADSATRTPRNAEVFMGPRTSERRFRDHAGRGPSEWSTGGLHRGWAPSRSPDAPTTALHPSHGMLARDAQARPRAAARSADPPPIPSATDG